MKFEREKPERKSIRLKGFDYSLPGHYFLTICVRQRLCLFGEVRSKQMQLNDAGRMIERWWKESMNKFLLLRTIKHIVMPNHFHGIVAIDDPLVSAALCNHRDISDLGGRPRRAAPTVPDIVGWFKTMTTNEYIRGVRECSWRRFSQRLWQRGYFEHIVWDEDELERIQEYIATNPERWERDPENPLAEHPEEIECPWETREWSDTSTKS